MLANLVLTVKIKALIKNCSHCALELYQGEMFEFLNTAIQNAKTVRTQTMFPTYWNLTRCYHI